MTYETHNKTCIGCMYIANSAQSWPCNICNRINTDVDEYVEGLPI